MPVPEAGVPVLAAGSADLVAPAAAWRAPAIKPADKPKLVRKAPAKKSMLSRTAQNQMALLASKMQAETAFSRDVFGDHDAEYGIDDLDLHRSFSRPQVVKVPWQDTGEDFAISDHARLRLFLARVKAVDAHIAATAERQERGAEVLSDAVRLRLFLARMKAVEAHEKKYS